MWGFPLKFTTPSGLHVIMRPYRDGEEGAMAEQISSAEVCKFLSLNGSQTPAQEKEWLRKLAEEDDSTLWAICLGEHTGDHVGKPIGTSGLHHIRNARAVSGVVIYDRSVWGKGLASACHRARCLYAHQVHGLKAIDSAVVFGNAGSIRALRGVGYEVVGTHYAEHMVDGQFRHLNELTWVNPTEHSWNYFWGDNEIPRKFHKARERAFAALERAHTEVTFL